MSNEFFRRMPPDEWKKFYEKHREEIEEYDRREIEHAHGLDHELDGTSIRVLLAKTQDPFFVNKQPTPVVITDEEIQRNAERVLDYIKADPELWEKMQDSHYRKRFLHKLDSVVRKKILAKNKSSSGNNPLTSEWEDVLASTQKKFIP